MAAYKIKKLTRRQRDVMQYMAGNGGIGINNHSIALGVGFYGCSSGREVVREGLAKCSAVCRQLISKGLLERAGWIGCYRTTALGEFDACAYHDANNEERSNE